MVRLSLKDFTIIKESFLWKLKDNVTFFMGSGSMHFIKDSMNLTPMATADGMLKVVVSSVVENKNLIFLANIILLTCPPE